jgi:hypothetical protein
MRGRRCWLVWLLLGAACASGAAADPKYWIDAAQDSTGLVWAVPQGGYSPLFTNDGSGWKSTGWLPIGGGNAAAIIRRPNGKILVLWNQNDPRKYSLTEHWGSTSRDLIQFSADLYYGPGVYFPSLFVDSKENVWITNNGLEIYRMKPNQPVEQIYGPVRPAQPDSDFEHSHHCLVRALEDGTGRIWFWADKRQGRPDGLEGFLVFDGEKIAPASIANLPAHAHINDLTNEDGGHLLAALKNFRLYRIDLATMEAEPLPEVAKGEYEDVNQVFCDGSDDYAITGGYDCESPCGSASRLWRWPRNATPKVVPENLDRGAEETSLPWIRSANGLIISTIASGLAFLADGAASLQRFDWRSGFAQERADRLFPLDHGRLLAIAFRGGSTILSIPPWPVPARSSRFEVIETKEYFVRDDRRHIWAVERGKLLEEWDGSKWSERSSLEDPVGALATDNQDRVWILSTGKSVSVWDLRTQKLTNYSDYRVTLAEQLRANPKFELVNHSSWSLAASGDGRLAFRDGGVGPMQYFDGKKWHDWPGNNGEEGYPRFESNGRLVLALGDYVVSRLEGETWVKNESRPPAPLYQDGIPESIFNLADARGSIARDLDGGYWFTNGRELFRARPGLYVRVLGETEATPFLAGREIERVIVDCNGNAFVRLNAWSDCLVVQATAPPPRTHLKVQVRGDSVRAKLSATGAGRPWFEWRLDNGRWSKPNDLADLILDSLPDGKHLLGARALDQELNLDTVGASAEFVVVVDRKKQVAQAMKTLHSKTLGEREQAVRILVGHPALALPLLQKARGQATADERWWIDAALQEIERSKARPSPVVH